MTAEERSESAKRCKSTVGEIRSEAPKRREKEVNLPPIFLPINLTSNTLTEHYPLLNTGIAGVPARSAPQVRKCFGKNPFRASRSVRAGTPAIPVNALHISSTVPTTHTDPFATTGSFRPSQNSRYHLGFRSRPYSCLCPQWRVLTMSEEAISVRGARVNNLKNISFSIPINQLTVVTGVSGSGKSSLAFDTIYAEGQRRYVESLSAYARQFLERMDKPDVDEVRGIAPAIAIRQKNSTRNPRSTVATQTEVFDYLRLLYARVGITYCRVCGQQVYERFSGVGSRTNSRETCGGHAILRPVPCRSRTRRNQSQQRRNGKSRVTGARESPKPNSNSACVRPRVKRSLPTS